VIIGDLLLAQVFARLVSKKIDQVAVANGITWGMPQARTQPPYGWIDTIVEGKARDTNSSRLRRVAWTLHLIVNNPVDGAQGSPLARQVSDALTFAPLVLTDGVILLNDDPSTRFLEEDYFWHVVMDFVATVRQKANYPLQPL
jgi:hypothetical protein